MIVALDVISWALILIGSMFSVLGALGILRFPDFFSRLHAAGLTDTLGAWSLLAGFMIQAGLSLTTVKLGLILLFLFFTSPTGTHALARAGLAANLKPWQRSSNSVADRENQ